MERAKLQFPVVWDGATRIYYYADTYYTYCVPLEDLSDVSKIPQMKPPIVHKHVCHYVAILNRGTRSIHCHIARHLRHMGLPTCATVPNCSTVQALSLKLQAKVDRKAIAFQRKQSKYHAKYLAVQSDSLFSLSLPPLLHHCDMFSTFTVVHANHFMKSTLKI